MCSSDLLALGAAPPAYVDAATAHEAELALVASYLAGEFSSAQQAGADPDYRDVRLRMTPIWAERRGEHWLYVEQALASTLDRPYRQRVYRLVWNQGVRSIVYTLPEAAAQALAGAATPAALMAPLAALGPARAPGLRHRAAPPGGGPLCRIHPGPPLRQRIARCGLCHLGGAPHGRRARQLGPRLRRPGHPGVGRGKGTLPLPARGAAARLGGAKVTGGDMPR